MSAQDQEVNFEYGFALRGERQVERGLDSIIERFARTGSVAETAGLALEKFGRIFEIGLPLALGAAVLGMVVDSMAKTGEEVEKTRRKIDQLTSQPLGALDTSQLDESLGAMGDELEQLGEDNGKAYGTGFWSAVSDGADKMAYNAIAATVNTWNSIVPYLAGLPGQNLPDFDENNRQQVSMAAREAFGVLDEKNQEKQIRSGGKSFLSFLSNFSNQNLLPDSIRTPQWWKNQETQASQVGIDPNLIHQNLDDRTSEGKENLARAKTQYNSFIGQGDQDDLQKASEALRQFTESISDGHDLTKDEISKGMELRKRENEIRTKINSDLEENWQDQKSLNDLIRQDREFRKDEIVASHGRSIGGGGGVFSNVAHYMGLHGGGSASALGSETLKTVDVMKQFSRGLKDAYMGVQDMGQDNIMGSTPTF